jgi:hypothetical protein
MMECAVLRSGESIRLARPRRACGSAAGPQSGGHDSYDYASTSLWVRSAHAPHAAAGFLVVNARS